MFSDGDNVTIEEQPGCSKWQDVITTEEQSSLFEPINEILSPSILVTQIPKTQFDVNITRTDIQNYTSSENFSTDDDDYIPNTSDSCDSIPLRSKRNTRLPITINESSETDTEIEEEATEQKKSKKRLRRPETWKCNMRRKKAITGKKHETQKGNTVSAKTIKTPCSCRKGCGTKVDNEQRRIIFEKYWNEGKTWDMKRQFILTCVRKKAVERRRIRNKDSRKQRNHTLEYKLLVDQKEIDVCKNFFLGTLGISETVVRNTIKKSSYGIVEEDKRGKKEPPNKTKIEVIDRIKKHIESFPKYESHYSREKTSREYLGAHINIKLMYKLYVEECIKDNVDEKMIAKIWTYRNIFNTNFNLGFKPPENDTCDDCDRFVIQIRGSEGSEREDLQARYDNHLKEAKVRYELKAFDKLRCLNPEAGKKMITVDLQKCLPTPLLTNGLSFYLRKLWTFNYTILDSYTGKSTCIMWDESVSGRGGNELSSGLIKWFQENVANTSTTEVTIWSDNCAGQNKNVHIIMCYLWLLKNIPNLKIINHKYLMKGHTHMEVDGVHSIIERKKKRQPQFSIMTPWDWQQFIRSCSSDKAPMEVINMSREDFKNLLILQEGTSAPFVHRKKGDLGQSVPYSEIVWMQLKEEDYGTMYYKISFQPEEFEKVSLIRNRRRELDITLPALQPIRLDCKPITTPKYHDLQKALQWVPPIFHDFYTNLAHNGTARDLPEPE